MDNLLYPFQPSPTMQKKYNPGPHDYEREIICHAKSVKQNDVQVGWDTVIYVC